VGDTLSLRSGKSCGNKHVLLVTSTDTARNRLDNDFIVFRGNDHEASGQLLKGTVVLCLSSPLKLEDIHLRLIGTAHYSFVAKPPPRTRSRTRTDLLASWTDAKITATGVSTHRVDKTVQFLDHRWQPFVGIGAPHPKDSTRLQTKGITLQPGNYEWPFELMLDGDTTESVEGLREAAIRYKLKATVARGKLLHDIHAYKQLRVIRTLEASALEFLHAMSIENIWPNKIDYSIVVPQKAVVFGSCIDIEMRFTPLLKGLEVGKITIKLMEIHDIILQSSNAVREHKKEREIDTWTIEVTREDHWQDVIQDSGPEGWEGQEGWVVHDSLPLPKRLTSCVQDVNSRGIKIRHKLKIVVALNNPDGHVSELRATLPVSIFISPNMPLDEEGNIVRQLPNGASQEAATSAPPAYEHHRLDQLYEDIEASGLYSPIGGRSGVSSPFRGHSRAGSTENLPAVLERGAIQPELLAHRLHSMSLEQRHRNSSWNSSLSTSGTGSRTDSPPQVGDGSPSTPLTRHNSGDEPSESTTPAEHLDYLPVTELSKVPSYQTAVRTPVRPLVSGVSSLPDYQTALSAPSTAPGTPRLAAATPLVTDNLDAILEPERDTPDSNPDFTFSSSVVTAPASRDPSPPAQSRRPTLHRRQFSSGFLQNALHMAGDGDEGRRLHMLQVRSG